MADRCTDYARAVVSGAAVAGEDQRHACERHLRDLSRQGTPEFPFRFDPDAAERVLRFAELLTVAEGYEPKALRLAPFQCFILGSLFGWKNAEGFRRFRIAYTEMARQNGKSFLNGIEGSYIALRGGYRHGRMFCCATKQAQSRIVFEEITKFIRSDPDLAELFEIKDYNSAARCLDTDCTIEALSKERQKLDGFRALWASLDELHQHRDNSVYKAVLNGTGPLPETLISMITTAGFDLNSFCYEMHEYAQKAAAGAIADETFFSCIFSLDKNDDYFDSRNYVKSNPFLATKPDTLLELEQAAARAREMGGRELRDFLTKRLNVWVQQADDQYMSADAWRTCGSGRTLEDMRGKACWAGLDLSSGGDLTSLALEFPLADGRYYVYSHSFMPRARLNEHIRTDLAPYDLWEKQGLITVTETFGGIKNDYKFILSHLRELIEENGIELQGIAYDTHNADGFLGDLETLGVPLLAVTQSARFLNDATVDFELEARAGNVEYDRGNELLTWSMLNAKTVKNSFGEIKVDKEPLRRTRRIDPVDSVIDAHVMCMRRPERLDLNAIAEDYFDIMGWRKKT